MHTAYVLALRPNLATLGACLFSALLIISLTPQRARACSCMRVSPEEAFAGADAVFEARVVTDQVPIPAAADGAGAVAPGDAPVVIGGSMGPESLREVRLRIVRAWKGIESNIEEITVKTATNSAACGYHFDPEQSHLVYATMGSDDVLRVGACSGTTTMEGTEEHLASLGPGQTPVSPTEPTGTAEGEGPAGDAPLQLPTQPEASQSGCASCAVGAAPSSQRGLAWFGLALVAGTLIRRRR